jgi:cysteine desulfurase
MENKIYLDYNATSPIDKEVQDAILPYINLYFGNPSSFHYLGKITKFAIEDSRKKIANFLHCNEDEIIFTSGGTESNNMAIKGIAFANKNKGNHIITSSIEHPSVLEVCKFLETKGFKISYLPVDETGRINIEDLKKIINKETILITIMHANNEIGTIQPIKEISEISKKNNIIFHSDASQSVGKIPTFIDELGVDMLTIAGHKLYAPKGIGILYIKRGIILEKLIHGASHEMNKRAGKYYRNCWIRTSFLYY